MARDGWFDGQGVDLFQIGVQGRKEEWNAYLKDGVVDVAELKKQLDLVKLRLAKMEPNLSDEQHREVTELIYDYELFNKLLMDYVCATKSYPLLR